jgi:hypothetical protein
MTKESKRKVKTKVSSSAKYVSSDDDNASDDDAPLPHGMNEKTIIKRLGKELVVRDQLLEFKRICLSKRGKTLVSSRDS